MKKKKCYITLNVKDGWKVVLDGRVVDCTKPLIQFGLGEEELEKAKLFCSNSNLEVIRICK